MTTKLFPLGITVAIACLLGGCGVHHTIKGRVVNADTQQPVQGAVVAINWVRYKLLSPPGYGPDKVRYGSSDSVTDAHGAFVIPKYQVGDFSMGVYKPGYICWNNETIFNPAGKTYEETYMPRDVVSLENGMVIKLRPAKGKDFPFLKHAQFVSRINDYVKNRIFADTTLEERKLEREEYLNRTRKEK